MKQIKRGIIICLIICVVFLMTACGSGLANSKYVGQWVGTTAEYDGLNMSVADLYGEFSFTLDEKGNAVLVTGEQENEGKWKPTDTGIILDDQMELIDESGNLTYTQDGLKITFEKQE